MAVSADWSPCLPYEICILIVIVLLMANHGFSINNNNEISEEILKVGAVAP